MKRIGMFLAIFCLVLSIIPTTSWSVDAQTVGLAFQEVAPPPEDAHAIRLSGKSGNPAPETWLKMRGTKAPPWWLGPCGSSVVRNVSQAGMIPFLPDPAKATGAAVILAPGGGTLVHCMDGQYQMAKWLNDRGIAVFVLKYRLVPTPKDLSAFLGVVERHSPIVYSDIVPQKTQIEESAATHEDGLEAVRYLRTHASQLKISPDRIGFMGFSAGGFTAAGVALQADDQSRPNIVALIYGTMPGELTVDAKAPPIFIAATSDDPLYSIGGSADPYLSTYRAWQQAHVPAELHMFDTGGHGFGTTPQGKSSDQWTSLLDHWLRERGFVATASPAAEVSSVTDDGAIHVRAFELPESSFLSAETRAALKSNREDLSFTAMEQACPSLEKANPLDAPSIRKCQAESFYKTPLYNSVLARYDVDISQENIGGVYTEIFRPKRGIDPRNRNRILINLHGGGFYCCARISSRLESIPISVVGRIEVVSIDYRQAPEYTFPAASEDVAAVYKQLLKTYKPQNIGIYGCSAGGALTAEAVAWFEEKHLPLPGAVGMFCSGAPTYPKGNPSDSGGISRALESESTGATTPTPNYFRGVNADAVTLANPGDYDAVMAKFPPSLLISGTRDMALSSVLYTHAQLVRLGVEADLHVWEGMNHAFNYFPNIPESREAYNVIAKFFDKHLGE